jgi:hypothetical protein
VWYRCAHSARFGNRISGGIHIQTDDFIPYPGSRAVYGNATALRIEDDGVHLIFPDTPQLQGEILLAQIGLNDLGLAIASGEHSHQEQRK